MLVDYKKLQTINTENTSLDQRYTTTVGLNTNYSYWAEKKLSRIVLCWRDYRISNYEVTI